MMSECIVPKWNLRQAKERNRSPHVHSDQTPSYVVPMRNNREVTELTWENGHISMHGLEGGINEIQGNTLESIVNQATSLNFPSSSYQKWEQINSMNATPSHIHEVKASNLGGKRGRSCDLQVEEISACGSASAAFCRDANDPTMMTWASFESPKSLKAARLANDDDRDSHYHDGSENQEGAKEESYRSQSSSRRSRAAAVHNLSERRRRDRINQKMKTLQKLVPNASKTDKASMLDEVIEYLKQLQAQVHMMSNVRNMPQMMMPNLGMQQLQMSLLARMGMGMGMGMGMLDANNLPRNLPHPAFPNSLMHASAPLGGATPSFVPPPFTMPPMIPPLMPLKPNVDASAPVPNFNEAYNTFIAQQSMNMDFLNKMSALYRQQQQQPSSKKPISLSLPNHGQGD